MCIIICNVVTTTFLLFIISFNLFFKDTTCIRVWIKMFIIEEWILHILHTYQSKYKHKATFQFVCLCIRMISKQAWRYEEFPFMHMCVRHPFGSPLGAIQTDYAYVSMPGLWQGSTNTVRYAYNTQDKWKASLITTLLMTASRGRHKIPEWHVHFWIRTWNYQG